MSGSPVPDSVPSSHAHTLHTGTDTIAAIATPPGIGSIGIVRISGEGASHIAHRILGRRPKPRVASYRRFLDEDGSVLDQGIALLFPAPNSFTGEDILELQGHGGPAVLDLLMARVLALGARLARPGEFSERAFLNGKMDLTQAEAIADLITGNTETQVRLANRTLLGQFATQIDVLRRQLRRTRSLVEATLDFPDEEIDIAVEADVRSALENLITTLGALRRSASQGELIRNGLRVVVAGAPNAGKSSLVNALVGRDTAIVTPIPGTTRDVLDSQIQIAGLPIQITDTAGLHHAEDPIEAEGVRRARARMRDADYLLWIVDDDADPQGSTFADADRPPGIPLMLVKTKIDLTGRPPGLQSDAGVSCIACSATTGAGIDAVRTQLVLAAGYRGPDAGQFSARRRHLDALSRTAQALSVADAALSTSGASELIAEELRRAQRSLGEITGEYTPEDVLNDIFSEFCIGK